MHSPMLSSLVIREFAIHTHIWSSFGSACAHFVAYSIVWDLATPLSKTLECSTSAINFLSLMEDLGAH